MNESSKDPRTGVSIDGFFSANYPEISKWAMEIASYDRFVSEDLIHDAYLKLLRLPPDLSIDDPNAYVYVAMRNTYRSQIRGRKRRSDGDITIFEDLLEHDFFHDPRWAHSVSDSLIEICEFACSRRRITISASLLILRYFLGYSAEDLSKVCNRSRSVIDTRLAAFRRDVGLQVLEAKALAPLVGKSVAWVESSLFEELRERVFRAPEGRCIPLKQLRRAYRWKSGRPDREELSHLASCGSCLEAANRLLKIEPLAQRHPLDVLRIERLLGSVLIATLSIISQLGEAFGC